MDANIIHGVTKEDVRPTHSLGEHFLRRLKELGDQVALVQEEEGVEISVTYTDLLAQSQRLSTLLRNCGLEYNGTVLLCIENTLHFAPISFATFFVGAAVAPVNPNFDTADMLHLINVVKPQVVIVNKDAESNVKEALTSYNETVVLLPIEEIERCMAEKTDASGDFRLAEIKDTESHVAFVMCSSGTSGKPKGVELVHASILTMLVREEFFQMYTTKKSIDGFRSVLLHLAGPYWVSTQLVTLFCITLGTKLVLLTEFTEHSFLGYVQKYRVTSVNLGPNKLVALAKYSGFSEFDLSSIQYIFYGGAPMSRAMLEMAKEKFAVPVVLMYGMTECMGLLLPAFDRRDRPMNVGSLAPNTSVKVVDINTGETLGAGKEGELCFKTRLAFKGYRGNEKATQDMYDADGFLHTGDVGYYDADGYFYIVDRIKELIKYRRYHVPASDIEEVLLVHPQVKEAAVIGVYHETDWEHATAAVVVDEGATVTAQDLIALVQRSLPKFKWLHGGVYFVTSLPRTASGKIQKHELRKQYAQQTKL